MRKIARSLALLSLMLVAFAGLASTAYAEGIDLIEDSFFDDTTPLDTTGIVEYEGVKYYVVSGTIQRTFTGFVQVDTDWCYIKNGVFQESFTGTIKGTVDGTEATWRVEAGKVSFESGIKSNDDGSKYVFKDGYVDTDFTGFYESEGDYYYVVAGKVSQGTTDTIKGSIAGGKAAFYLVRKGVVSFETCVFKKSNGSWIIEDGKVNFNANGFVNNGDTWYYCSNGKVQTGLTTIVKDSLDGEMAWWYVKKGVATFENLVATNKSGNWIINNGKVNFGLNGFYENGPYWWYVLGGKIQNKVTTVAKGVVKGETAWWYVGAGKVCFGSGMVKNMSNGQTFVVKNGKVDFSAYGFYKNTKDGTYYYISAGKVLTGFTGPAKGTKDGKYGTYYLEKGKFKKIYGLVKYKEDYYYFREGILNTTYDGFAEDISTKQWYYIVDGQPTEGIEDRITSSLFVIVDCDNQKVCLVKEGKTVYSTPCVTGNVKQKNMTRRGLFYIYSKETNRDLKGADYVSHVKYWMPFDENRGLHDASWRSSFGGTYYLKGGSHGCVNMPTAAAKYIFSQVKVGTKVLVFGGLQSYK